MNDDKYEKTVRAHIRILSLVFVLFPIGSALTGIIGSVSPITLLLAIYVVFALIHSYKLKIKLSRSTIVVLLYFIYVCLSLLWGWHSVYQRWYITNILINAGVFFMAAIDKYRDKEIKLIRNSLTLGVLVALVVSIVCRVLSQENRLIITIFSSIDPNEFGFNLCFYASFILADIARGNQKIRNSMILIMLAVVVIMTGSRGSMLTFIFMFLAWFVIYGKGNRCKIILFGAIVVTGVFLIFHDTMGAYMRDRLNIFSSLLADGGAGRLKIWEAALQKFKTSDLSHQLFGHGFGTFPNVVHYIAPGHTKPYESHNIFIDCLITGGIIGCILLFSAFAAMIVHSFKKGNICGLLSTIALFVASMALDLQNYKAFALVFVIGIIFSDRNEISNKRRNGHAVKRHCSHVQNRAISS